MVKIKKPIRGKMPENVAEIAGYLKSSKPKAGTMALFAGPAGTGKTMAAEALAAETGRNLYRIDLAGVISKYIGETEKNLDRVFEKAAANDVFLFFDEADALFGQRTGVRDAHDRYTNTDTNYLLQRIEQYPGLVILTSNSKKNLDPALLRKVRFTVDF
ncbi:MAG: ATP-binding protein [Deltaproteobacteria bacterium]|jgi:SpoVK/Ycf46/Vps4 family AAA+-type ATPase|nr:ATP-binding protein [Deltaproteobacteria bacterium]